jgi:hypothetical protein
MKILITGASGKIGKIVRNLFSEHILHLYTRKYIELNPNEFWYASEDLINIDWWSNFYFIEYYDIIFHLAEPVKAIYSKSSFLKIVDSHSNFLILASNNSKKVVYPTTAYKYDKINLHHIQSYLEIKNSVIRKIVLVDNVVTPVIHPIIDLDSSLSKSILFSRKLPLFNYFSEFDSCLPILYSEDLNKYLLRIIDNDIKNEDVFSVIMKISLIYHDSDKINSKIISKATKFIIYILNIPRLKILIVGRNIS